MAGKSYSIREMKAMVDYLTENKLYGEIKGRKMWIEYASSQLTSRTWQSLKETFLKRVLPDIHNPYYKLTIEQINSFRAGYDIGDRNKNKLEIHTVSDDSDDPNQNDTPQTSNGKDKKQDDDAGESLKSAKIPLQSRSSADTVIIETCYETAEDIQKDLESPRRVEKDEKIRETKSLRDCITYSEPLTPMLQEVLDDFQSEPENEPNASDNIQSNQSQIATTDVENLENISNEVSKIVQENQNNKSDHVVDVTSKMDANSCDTVEKELVINEPESIHENTLDPKKNKPDADTTKKNESKSLSLENTEHEIKQTTKELNNIEKGTVNKTDKSSEISVEIDQVATTTSIPLTGAVNNSNNTPDASLPNNPEALKKRDSNESQIEVSMLSKNEIESKISRKRLHSEDIVKIKENKKTKLEINKLKANSENESKKATRIIDKTKAKSVEPMCKQEIGKQKHDKIKGKNSKLENVLEKSSTIIADKIEKKWSTSDNNKNGHVNESSEIKNPCLQNLSLYEEQFRKTKYNSSESSDIEHNKKKDNITEPKKIAEKQNEIVMLKSHTESNTDSEQQNKSHRKKQRAGVASVKLDRDRGLAKVFGFASGASHSKRKRQLSRRRRTTSHNNVSQNYSNSGTSEWTSESDSEVYVSPPRGRKNRQTKKYLKPHYARIHSLEEEGGLFVMYGKKIYPLVKDGKLVKHYLTYLPESESDEENYWKLKYVEEKKRAAELKKLLQQTKEPQPTTSASSPVDLGRLRKSTSNRDNAQASLVNKDKEICLPSHIDKNSEQKTNAPENIKIKFTTTNDQEIHLEGNWPQLQNALEHVVHIFQKPQSISESKPKAVIAQAPSSSGIASPVVISSIEQTVADPEIHEKVNMIEGKIFEEIENRDKAEQEQSNQQDNVTKRKPVRTPILSETTSESPPKRVKTSDPQEPAEAQENNINNANNALATEIKDDKEVVAPKKQLRTPRKVLNESLNTNETTTIQTRRSKSKVDTSNIAIEAKEDEEILYMLPPKNKKQNIKSTNVKTRDKKSANKIPMGISLETACPNSMESTQGYQDSDPSPMKNELRKKKRLNTSDLKYKSLNHVRRSTRKNPGPFLYYGDSSNSSVDVLIKKNERDSSNTEAYRSESYQLLIPRMRKSFSAQKLDPIDETRLTHNKEDSIKHLDSVLNDKTYTTQMETSPVNYDSTQINSDFGSSSNISFPLSPELSVVESLSISKELLNTIKDGPTINEMQCNDVNITTDCNQFLMSDIDISVPLMQQTCTLESSNVLSNEKDVNRNGIVTESLLNQVQTCNIEDQSNLTDTLDMKLRDLLLESAKKIAKQNAQEKTDNMEVDETNLMVNKKGKYKKRSSTPRKRKSLQKSKIILKVQDVIEEQIENFAQGGRKSCPPIIQPSPIETNVEEEEINFANLTIDKNIISKGKKKKDIIKVKITRPKSKKNQNEGVKDKDKTIICNDSGIHATESGPFLVLDESVDLIHNHSDTCLHANECVGDSVEFVENSIKSVLTLDDSSQSENMWRSQCEINDANNVSPDFRCKNVHRVKSFYKPDQDNILNTSETIFHSPLGTEASSLITDDLSDDLTLPPVPSDKWHLLSEDETTNVDITKSQDRATNISSFGANLKQIFPVSYAVPDLSTISEMSRETEDNKQNPLIEGPTGSAFDSATIFNPNF